MISKKWVSRFLELANLVASWSKDPSSKVGAVICKDKFIVSVGFNGFPVGTDDHPHLYEDKDEKYPRIVHAEMNAILSAREDLTGASLYCTHFPCSTCAGAIIQKHIQFVVFPQQNREFIERWATSMKHTLRMFKEVGVKIYQFNVAEQDLKEITNFIDFYPRKI
jgi:dCMP deaminase